jgi:cell division protein FtsZ
MMGTGEATGEKRAIEAAEAAISNPLLDDVSMRGARGLLISITGGPDLTLYEVDEAATRIREEVDPEANIILGATFDESLEGTMRVSVVATGLASEAGRQVDASSEDKAEAEESSRTVFGFTGKQPSPVKRHVQPAPMAARATAHPPQTMPSAQERYNADAEAEEAQQAMNGEAQRQPARPARIPSIDEFPPIAQQQMAAQQRSIENIADHSGRKKKGLFERLASVGLGRRDESAQMAQREPTMAGQPRPQQVAPIRPQAPADQHRAEPPLDDDQLEIPAFLRRQAN